MRCVYKSSFTLNYIKVSVRCRVLMQDNIHERYDSLFCGRPSSVFHVVVTESFVSHIVCAGA